ncbi:MAG: M48 family metalloprotease, partial [Deltaproteobacteria bacterium]|nr:M48 family metalloprotease [Deltaproteobacteria bacterium]
MNLLPGKLIAVSAIILVTCLAAGCAINPVSGRPEVTLISENTERELGTREALKVEQTMGLVQDPELVAYVETLGGRLAAHSPRRDVDYTFHVVDMVEPNAFALPGGYVYVSRGLLALANSEDELAGVMGHEIAHVAARHAAQRVTATTATAPVRIATGIAGAVTGIVAPGVGETIAGVGQVTSALVIAPYSRSQEREADRVGQEIVADAGWDPNGLSSMLETLGHEEALASGEARQNSFFATHPSMPERVSQTTEHAAELKSAAANPIARDRADLLAKLEGLLLGNDPAQGVFIENQFLQPILDFFLLFPAGWQNQNNHDFVAAKDPGGKGLVVVGIAGEGNDPVEVLRQMEQKQGKKLLENAEQKKINGLQAVQMKATVDTSEGRMGAAITWIAHKGLVFQIAGISPVENFNDYQEVFSATAHSFRPLTESDSSRIKEARLRIVRA